MKKKPTNKLNRLKQKKRQKALKYILIFVIVFGIPFGVLKSYSYGYSIDQPIFWFMNFGILVFLAFLMYMGEKREVNLQKLYVEFDDEKRTFEITDGRKEIRIHLTEIESFDEETLKNGHYYKIILKETSSFGKVISFLWDNTNPKQKRACEIVNSYFIREAKVKISESRRKRKFKKRR